MKRGGLRLAVGSASRSEMGRWVHGIGGSISSRLYIGETKELWIGTCVIPDARLLGKQISSVISASE